MRDADGVALGRDENVTSVQFAIVQGPQDAVLTINPTGRSVQVPASGNGEFAVNLISLEAGQLSVAATIIRDGQPPQDLPSTAEVSFTQSQAVGQLVLVQQPVLGENEELLSVQPRIELRDAGGNLATSDSQTFVRVTVIPENTADIASLNRSQNGVVAQAQGGIVQFDGLILDGAIGQSYRLVFTEDTDSAPSFLHAVSDVLSVGGSEELLADLQTVLQDDLRDAIEDQQETFQGISSGALSRLQNGEMTTHCGDLRAIDPNGSLVADPSGLRSNASWDGHVFDCNTNTHILSSGSYALTYSAEHELGFRLSVTEQRERFVNEDQISGHFWGGYLRRNIATGNASGTLDGLGVNAGLYGARRWQDDLYVDYYAALAAGLHRYDLAFAQHGPGGSSANGTYSYAAAFGGAALSGSMEFDQFTLYPRAGLEFAYAWSSNSEVTINGSLETIDLEIPDYRGIHLFFEPRFEFERTVTTRHLESVESLFEVIPSFSCRDYGDNAGADCDFGLDTRWALQNLASNRMLRISLGYMFGEPEDSWEVGLELDMPAFAELGNASLGFSLDNDQTVGLGLKVTAEW